MNGEPRQEKRDRTAAPAALAIARLLSLVAVGALAARALTTALGRSRDAGTSDAAPANPRLGHESSDLPAGPAALAIAGLLSLIAVGALVAWALTASFERRHPSQAPSAFERAAATPALPRLEVNGRAARLAIEQRAEARLAGYGWADRQGGLVHIPIQRAMALQAQAGWPDADAGLAGAAPGNGEGRR